MIGVALAAAADGEPVYVMTRLRARHRLRLRRHRGQQPRGRGRHRTAKTAAPSTEPTRSASVRRSTTTSASGSVPTLVRPFMMQGVIARHT